MSICCFGLGSRLRAAPASRFVLAVLWSCLLIAGYGDEGAQSQPPEETEQEPAISISLEVVEGELRVFLLDEEGQPVLIRSRPYTGQHLSDAEKRRLATQEVEAVKQWRACLRRFVENPPQSYLEQHDAWLEVAELLEHRHTADTEHLGVLRDLVTAYCRVLAFERNTPLGTDMCRLASVSLEEFERRAHPLVSADREQAVQWRALLCYIMHQYPLAAAGGDPEAWAAQC